MSEENRTEQPTPKKLREAIERGDVVQSPDLTSMCVLLAGLAVLWFGGSALGGRIVTLAQTVWSGTTPLDAESFAAQISNISKMFLPIFIGLALAAAVIPAVLTLPRLGFRIFPNKIAPDFSRLALTAGWARLFSAETLTRLLTGTVKLALFALIFTGIGRNILSETAALAEHNARESAEFLFRSLLSTARTLTLALTIVAVADFFLRRWQWRKKLRMTPEEIRREMRESQGSPEVKSRRNELIRTLLNQVRRKR